jgi:hypothetical protein
MRKAVAISLILISVALCIATLRLSLPYLGSDLPQTLLSFIGPMSSLIAGVILFSHSELNRRWIATKWGLCLGGYLFVALQTCIISINWDLILDDGVAYWIYVNLPSLLLGVPACLVGALIGWLVELVRKRMR